MDRRLVDTSRLCTASRRATSARNSTSESFIRPTMSPSRSCSTPETRFRFCSRVLICSSRAAMFDESAETPRRAPRNSSGVLRVRSARVVSDFARRSVSIRSEVCASPENASTTSYGELVRSTGISDPSASWPSPAGSSERYIAPSSVLTLMAARVSSPNAEGVSTRKVTFTWSPSSATLSTLPTRTPAIRTSSFALRPPDSENAA